MSPDYFRDLLKMIRVSELKPIHSHKMVEAIASGEIKKPSQVVITFDDGERGVYEHAFPVLKEFGYPATSFVFIEGINTGPPRRSTWEELHEMKKSGLMAIHSHSMSHQNFSAIEEAELEKEIEGSFTALKQQGFEEPLFIAYPYGKSTDKAVENARRAGYQAGFIASGNPVSTANTPLYELNRTTFCQFFDQSLTCKKLGLSLEKVRQYIQIYDDKEAIEHSGFEMIDCKNNLAQGQYVDSYLVGDNTQSVWKQPFGITHPARYTVSLWIPLRHDVSFENGTMLFQLTIFNQQIPEKKILSKEINLKITQKNGWNPAHELRLQPGEYTLEIRGINGPFIIDAVKVERAER